MAFRLDGPGRGGDMRYLGYGPVVGCLLFFVVLAHAEPSRDALAQLRAVGREGAGNEAAARAWKDVVCQGPAALPAILQEMEDADVTAANWLRTAVDAIAERALAAGKSLPVEQLEQFVQQTKHNSAARRLAY